ncbi:MAG: pyruvate, phosphate dikinase [Cyclobacteriaceae bacterium]
MNASDKKVYFFAANESEGSANMKTLLGGKGANLAEMCNLGIPVPPGFTITTAVCNAFYENDRRYPEGLREEVDAALARVEKVIGKKFGDPNNPLLLSVRSGAPASMPGMMDTVLNLGINDEIAEGLSKQTNNSRFAWDSYRRFIQMYGDVVMGLKPENNDVDVFEEIIEHKKKEIGKELDTDLSVEDLKDIVANFKTAIYRNLGRNFPEDPKEQLWGAISAVFNSWQNTRAITYRRLNNIPAEWGTAVNVQSMVYGNMGNDSGTGVAFTRDPSTGVNQFYGEYLVNAQGEDIVAGTRTPQPINKVSRKEKESVLLETLMPDIYRELLDIRNKLEQHYREMQDVEFTIERGRLWMLQTRTGKRTSTASLRIAVEMVEEGLITKEEAILRINPEQIDHLLHPTFDPKAEVNPIAKGLPASPGAAVGKVVFSAKDAEEWTARGEQVILVRMETSPEDIGGMNAANGILTSRGGMTSHAAVVARGMGKCCITGCRDIIVMYNSRQFKAGAKIVKEGDYISINGTSGEVMEGQIPTIEPELTGNFEKLMKWTDSFKSMKVRTNSDTPHDSRIARKFGAEGIGLCRTEHMFFEGNRIEAIREMILAEDELGRRTALAKILPMQIEDFSAIFEVMEGFPVTIRTFDPPLHEFLPDRESLFFDIMDLKMKLKEASGLNEINQILKQIREHEALLAKVDLLKESNPMLGLRGCRLGIIYPELTEMQATAIFEAACAVKKKGMKVKPEIMIPLVSTKQELELQKEIVVKVAHEIMNRYQIDVEYEVGTMIELPRAALIADKIAETAQFFSFGTNDLTQTTLGLSRDDSGVFLPKYVESNIYLQDPFQHLDVNGVGQLVKIGAEKGRSVKPNLKLGVCGEHGGDPYSIEFLHHVGVNYVSCSPYRVPVARLAAAQSALKHAKNEEISDN